LWFLLYFKYLDARQFAAQLMILRRGDVAIAICASAFGNTIGESERTIAEIARAVYDYFLT
jgi:hypothetical protein